MKESALIAPIQTKNTLQHDRKHMATDSHECEILKAKIKKFIDNTDYTIMPVIPRYIGKVEFSKQKPVSPAAVSPAAVSLIATKSVSPGISSKALHEINTVISSKHKVQQVPPKRQTRARTKQLSITDDE